MDSTKTMNQFRTQIEAELNKEGVNETLEQLRDEMSSREVRRSYPGIVTWEPQTDDPKSFGLQPPEGSMVLWWGTKRSGIIRELEYAYSAHDIELLNILAERLVEEHQDRPVVSVEEAVEMLRQSAVWFDLRYGGKTLAQNLWLTDTKAGTMMFPYNGGRLQDNEFHIVEYLEPSRYRQVSPYDILLVKSPPKLTELEKAALAAVPADILEMNISNAGTVFATPGALATVVAFAAINTCICTLIVGGRTFADRLSQVSLSDSQIRRLGSVASARELLTMRAQIFEEFGIR